MTASPPSGAVLEFRSPVDGLPHPCAVTATDDGPDPKALVLEVSPGAIADLPGAVAITDEMAAVARAAGHSAVILRPTGRGPGTVYQDYGEVDVLEAIEFVASRWPIDRDRISITGASMGGAATWYLLAHYPDLFAAGAPFCGYADYRLWRKPGGLANPLRPWEEPSWQARSAALLAANLEQTPVWAIHGAWDRAVGGGVDVEQSRSIVAALEARGAPIRYTEVPRVGHAVRQPAIFHEVIRWLLEQRRARDGRRVALTTGTLRHNVSRWLTIGQFERYGELASAEAAVGPDGVLRVQTDNVRRLALRPPDGPAVRAVALDNEEAVVVDLRSEQWFEQDRGRWLATTALGPTEKRHGSSGPIGDLFHERMILVPGTIGGDEATFFNTWMAEETAEFYRARNGGVHRGGILGRNTVTFPVIRDVDICAEDRATSNLLLFGTTTSNAIQREYGDSVAIGFGPNSVRVADREWHGPGVAAFAIFRHPEHDARYVAVHGGPEPDSITAGSHLDIALLPDHFVYGHGDVLEWGFRDSDWRMEKGSR